MGLERRGRADQGQPEANPLSGEEPRARPEPKVKSFEIDKRLVYGGVGEGPGQRRGAGRGRGQHRPVRSSGEGQPLQAVEPDELGELFPGPVRAVEIPKDHGAGVRVLGVPNTADRVAQTAAAMLLEEKLEPIFHPRQLRLPSWAQRP